MSNITQIVPQKVVLCAHALLLLQSAHDYGFVEGGPAINVERCEEIIAANPLPFTLDEISQAAVEFMNAINDEIQT